MGGGGNRLPLVGRGSSSVASVSHSGRRLWAPPHPPPQHKRPISGLHSSKRSSSGAESSCCTGGGFLFRSSESFPVAKIFWSLRFSFSRSPVGPRNGLIKAGRAPPSWPLGHMEGASANQAPSTLGAPELVSRQAGRGRAGRMEVRTHTLLGCRVRLRKRDCRDGSLGTEAAGSCRWVGATSYIRRLVGRGTKAPWRRLACRGALDWSDCVTLKEQWP